MLKIDLFSTKQKDTDASHIINIQMKPYAWCQAWDTLGTPPDANNPEDSLARPHLSHCTQCMYMQARLAYGLPSLFSFNNSLLIKSHLLKRPMSYLTTIFHLHSTTQKKRNTNSQNNLVQERHTKLESKATSCSFQWKWDPLSQWTIPGCLPSSKKKKPQGPLEQVIWKSL